MQDKKKDKKSKFRETDRYRIKLFSLFFSFFFSALPPKRRQLI